MAKRKNPNAPKMHRRTYPVCKTGRKSPWPQIKARLAEIEELIGEKFVSVREIPSKYLGISYQTFLVLRGKHPELEGAVKRGKEHRNELVLKGMYDLATGRAVRVEDEKSPDESGKLRLAKRRIVRLEPQAGIGTMLMKQYAGWRDNPKTDDAVAKALSNEETAKKAAEILGIANVSKRPRRDGTGDGGAVDPKPAPDGQALPLVRGYEAPVGRADGDEIVEEGDDDGLRK